MIAPGCLIDWSQLASALDFDVITSLHSPSLKQSAAAGTPSFMDLLAPLNRGACHRVIDQVKRQLQVVQQTLTMLDGQTFDLILQDLLKACALKVGELLNADRTTVFLVDRTRQQLWSLVAKTDESNRAVEIRLPWHQGIAGEVARTRRAVNVPFDFYDDPRSQAAKDLEAKTGYRTYTLLALPVFDSRGNLLAVVELLNKCHSQISAHTPLVERLDLNGFSSADESAFADFVEVFQLILESSQAFYLAARRQKAATTLIKATQALNHSGPTLEATLQRVMKEAQNLLDADRSRIWLLDRDRQDLWTNLPDFTGKDTEVRIPVGTGYVGRVAATGQLLNVPCDLYGQPDSAMVRQLDQHSGYRTYSLLCMPVFDTAGTLIAVTQLLNKYRLGVPREPRIQPGHTIPECFQASFSEDDEFFMLAFNIHAGVAIERALMYQSLEAQVVARTQELQRKNEQLQREIEERVRAEKQLNQLNRQLNTLARIDPLTQVANRRQFEEHVMTEWRRMRRSRNPLSLILCDIDFFKRYNDHYGHPAGDACLRRVAAVMQRRIKRAGDLLARYGGEEFVVVLPNTDAEGARCVAESLREAVFTLAVPHEASEVASVVTLSLGVATCVPPTPGTVKELIQKADAALYQAKAQGRNRTMLAAASVTAN